MIHLFNIVIFGLIMFLTSPYGHNWKVTIWIALFGAENNNEKARQGIKAQGLSAS
jgi:hypothetical protein